jgi:hypothetical protein
VRQLVHHEPTAGVNVNVAGNVNWLS